ncbi:MAG: GGDEF domain-containing protein [Scytonema sp. PMC 1069.18]|nr:GGDEF domain-containing protein [Scytonema sp. PMC 1069.18]MEC4887514.1 GGDEF domain-containing protein [Scytonema sp. PMC 1070.18]
MNVFIMVFGGNNFFAKLPNQIRNASAFSVEVINDLDRAVSQIQIAPPDVILVQGSLDGSMELCHWLKEQTQLSWIYCLLLEDRPQALALRNQYGKAWELEMTSCALQEGADAYIWYVETSQEESLQEENPQDRLLLAHLSVGLRKAQKYRDLVKTNDFLSTIAWADSLTGLQNRRYLDWYLPEQIQQARSHETPLSLIILDVDHFKKVNDTYGHLVGDRVLQLLSKRLRHNLRFQDTPFRYGGEEFVIVLPNTTIDEALTVARRLNRIVSEELFVINNGLSMNVTISLGTSCLKPEDDGQGMSLLNRADKHLLKAKATGRNCIIGCSSSTNTIYHPSLRQAVGSQSS